jgi:hypothetical protein
MFSCNEVAQVNISSAMNLGDMTIAAQCTRYSSTHICVIPGRAQDFDHLSLIYALSLVTAVNTHIFSVQKEGPRNKWYSCINLFRQSFGIVNGNWATTFGPREGFVLDHLDTWLELSFNYARVASSHEKEDRTSFEHQNETEVSRQSQ